MLELRFYSKKELEKFYEEYPEAKDILEKLGKPKGDEIIIWEDSKADSSNFVDVLSEMENLDETEEMAEAFREAEYESVEIDY